MVPPPLILASASPRRAALLRDAGVSVEVRVVPCDETPRPAEAALPYATRVAEAKLRAAFEHLGTNRRVLTADTVVWIREDEAPLGKPTTPEACVQMLRMIGGPHGHHVTTAWAIGTGPDDVEVHTETTNVWFRPLSAATRRDYATHGGWRDKAGGYGIQAEAAGWVTRIDGSYTNVVGLPLAQVLTRLEALRR